MGSKVNPKELQQTVNDMATAMKGLVKVLGEMNDPLVAVAKTMKSMTDSVSDVADSLDDTISKYKQINSLSMRLNRLTDKELDDRVSLKKILEASLKEMKAAEKALEGDANAASKVRIQIEAMDEVIAKVADGSLTDLQTAMGKFRDATLDAAKAIKTIDLSEPIKGAEALGDAFGKALSGLKVLDNHGFKGLIGQLETTRNKVKALRDESKKDIKENKARAIDKFGTSNLSDLGSKFRGAGSKAEQDSMLRALSGKTGASGWMDRKLGSMAMNSAKMGGTDGGLMSRGAGTLMQMGGGSVMGGLGAVASRVALPVAIVTGILQVLQKGFDRNKETYSALGGGGLVGTEGTAGSLRGAYTGWNKALTSQGTGFGSGTGRFYGMDFEKSLDAMKEVVESGIAVQSNQGGIHKNRNIDEVISGGRATDIYSGVMRNAAVFGKPIGLDSTEAARESMKMMKEFSLSMGEVEDLFISIHQAVQTTGISTSKYLELINGITSQFDKFNKSLNFTVALVATLGKGAKYTADDLQGMVKGLMGEKKDLVQSAFAYQTMGRGGREGLVKGYEQQSGMTREELRKQKGFEDITEKTTPEEILRRAMKNGDQATMTLAQRYNAEETKAGAGRRLLGKGEQEQALGFAALDSNTGNDPKSSIVKQLSLLNVAMQKSGGSLLDFRQSDQGQIDRTRDALSNPILTKISEMLGLNISDTQKYMTQTMSQMASEVELAGKAGGGKESDEAADRLRMSDTDRKALTQQLAGGTKANDTDVFKNLFDKSGMARMANSITEEARRTTEAAAEKNQRFLTGPLDYIQKALAALVENIVKMLTTLVNWATWTMFADNRDKIEENKKSAEGYEQGTNTADRLDKNIEVMQKYGTDPASKALLASAKGVRSEFFNPDTKEQITDTSRETSKDTLGMVDRIGEIMRNAEKGFREQAKIGDLRKTPAELKMKDDEEVIQSRLKTKYQSIISNPTQNHQMGLGAANGLLAVQQAEADKTKFKTSAEGAQKAADEAKAKVGPTTVDQKAADAAKLKPADHNTAPAAVEAAKNAAAPRPTAEATVEVIDKAPAGEANQAPVLSSSRTTAPAVTNIFNSVATSGNSTIGQQKPNQAFEVTNMPGYAFGNR